MTNNKFAFMAIPALAAIMILGTIAPASAGILTIAVDVKPNSCPNKINVSSNGVIPVAILGSADFDVTQIDISTLGPFPVEKIRYEDVATPFEGELVDQSSCNEDGPDGIVDLVFKIKVNNVGCPSDGSAPPFPISGQLLDGTPFSGFDFVEAINKKGCV